MKMVPLPVGAWPNFLDLDGSIVRERSCELVQGGAVVIKPQVIEHDGVFVVRDDLFEGGTKARFIPLLFNGDSEVVYASPAEGGAQTALATVASQLGKRATIFVAQRAQLHPRTLMAKGSAPRSCQFRRVISTWFRHAQASIAMRRCAF